MKKMKKLLSVLLTLVMVLAMAAPGFAADNGSITISNATRGQEYNIYQIFTLTYATDEDGNTIRDDKGNATTVAYKVTDPNWKEFVTKGAGKDYVSVDSQDNVSWKDGSSAEGFAKAAIAYAKATGIASQRHETPTADGQLTFSDLPYGYYLVDSEVGTLCTLNSTTPSMDITDKNVKPTVDKKVATGSDAQHKGPEFKDGSVNVGDTLYFEVVIHAQKGAENYVLTDTMTSGLTLDTSSISANIASSNYTVTNASENGFTFTLTKEYCEGITEPTDINVTYTATVNSNAIDKTAGDTNTATLKYGEDSDIETTPAVTTVKTYNFGLQKIDGKDRRQLDGAQFSLYTAQTGGTAIALVKDGDVYRKPTASDTNTTTIIEAGHVTIKGLANGTYWLGEEKAPNGYNKLEERIEVTIADANLGDIPVENNAGSLLPSTGGIGTTIFYAAGIILMAGAVFFVVRRKRA